MYATEPLTDGPDASKPRSAKVGVVLRVVDRTCTVRWLSDTMDIEAEFAPDTNIFSGWKDSMVCEKSGHVVCLPSGAKRDVNRASFRLICRGAIGSSTLSL